MSDLPAMPNAWDVLGAPDFQLVFDDHKTTVARRRRVRLFDPDTKPVLSGHRLIALKRANRVVTRPHPRIVKTPEYKAFEAWALAHLKSQRQRSGWRTSDAPHLWVPAVYYPPNRVGWPDTDGMIATAYDLLQHAGIITNDRQVRRTDGSEILEPGCGEGRPRLMVWVREIEMRGRQWAVVDSAARGGKSGRA